MAKKGSATAKLGLDYSAFESGAKAVASIAKSMNTVVTAAVAFTAIKIGLNSFDAIKTNVMDVLTLGESMANAAKIAGAATGQFMLFDAALQKGFSYKTAAALLGANAAILDKNASVFRDVSIKLWAADGTKTGILVYSVGLI